ncbi:sugar transferase [Nocardioides sp. GY 10127]|uniref:sugar transferase n=1 Tax=Nocardioides sp. GY 10127 TaxID=2569762 RepID=UPI0010A93C75|nr:sugar transferase [Nocardioides sp. GY 10127]TIC79470.1 sugar transferase [Nocardioides sp. GY 10127]
MTILSDNRRLTSASAPSRMLRYLPTSALIIDAVLIALTGTIAVIGRRELTVFDTPASIAQSLTVAGPAILLSWLAVIALAGGYAKDVFGAGLDEFKRVVNATLIAGAVTGVGCYLTKFDLSRGFFLLAFGLGIPFLVLGRYALRNALHSARRRGALRQRILIVGSRAHIDETAAVLRRESWLGYQIVGALTPEWDLSEETASGIPVLGNADEAASLAVAARADALFFAGGSVGSPTQLRRNLWDLEKHHVDVVVAPSVTDISQDRISVRPVGGLPLMHIDPPTWSDASRWGKRLFDLVGSGMLIFAFLPLIGFAALQIWLFDRGPILFRQTRIGKDGEEFKCFKFRTMVVNAEDLVADLQKQLGQSALLFKMKDDPRITRPGKWMRRFSVDELPQLFNVFLGDMSLIGPRPQVQREVDLYDSAMTRRLHVRPGMTGLWQVSGRNDLTAEEAMRLDLYYVDNWSMLQDLSILSRTFGAVFASRGAY